MDLTINQIDREFRYIATQHRQINDYYFGEFVDAINKEQAPKYPYLIVTLQPASMNDSEVNVNAIITLCDQYTMGNNDMIREIHSDCLQILNDIRVTMKQERWVNNADISTNISTEPFINRGHDMTAGWSMSVQISVFDAENWCNIPYDNYDFENGTQPPIIECLPVTVTDGLEIIEVPSGGFYTCSNQPNEITVSNSDDSYSVTTAENLVLPDTEYIFTVDGNQQAPIFLPTLSNQTINVVWQ
jgi:hypothetical protein